MLAGWPLAAVLGVYVLYVTRDWDLPTRGGADFAHVWLVGTGILAGAVLSVRRRLDPLVAIAAGAVVAMVLTDIAYLSGAALRDFHLYLRAGERFLAGGPVYLAAPVTTRPPDPADYPYLYPPVTLPVFAALSRLPRALADAVWVAGSVGAVVVALRLFGVRGRWLLVLLAWPPILQGLQVGNVAVPLALLFALAPWVGAGLVLAAVFKLYSGVAALWLVRERRIGSMVAGIAVVVAACVVTLPLTGADRWTEWWAGLGWFRASQAFLLQSFYGFALAVYVPTAVAVAVGIAVVLLALRPAGREGLGRLGLATAVASPSLYSHGLIVTLPAFLALRTRPLWVALTITSVAPGAAWWAAIALVVAAWLIPGLARERDPRADGQPREGYPPDPYLGLHPLGTRALWPTAPDLHGARSSEREEREASA